MNYYFVTGSSRGIGKAIVDLLLEDSNNYVFGLSRTESKKRKNFKYIKIDFVLPFQVNNFVFPKLIEPESIHLINNAGVLGQVKQLGRLKSEEIIKTYNINIISPAILCNSFINTYKDFEGKKVIINVSSGAARHAIESWSAYCSSKSALDMFSQVVWEEQANFVKNPVKIYSVAPGIVETVMQEEIRKLNKEDFRKVNTFISYKTNNQLLEPRDSAKKILYVINNTSAFDSPILDVRNF
ncbi:MAG: SDR family NAD(P)-dependent oxidoreductase [Bacteroidales bacterium]|nr:SDR family NAD(P)-dependent oxidoreductase [Bacteroidales bacterium]